MLRNINLIKRLIMNEIQKFKKNRMIPKGQYGLKPHEILGAVVNGNNVAYVNIPGKGYIAIDGKGNAYTYGEKLGPSRQMHLQRDSFKPIKLTNYDRQHIYKAATRDNGMTGFDASVNDIAKYWAAQGKPKVKPVKALVDKKTDTATNDASDAVGSKKPAGKRGIKRPLKSQEQWNNDFQTMRGGLSSQQQMYLDSLGIDMSSAETMQAGINKYLGNNNLAVDNKWGNKSQGALDALLRYMPKDYQNDDMKQGLANEANLPNDALIDAPDPFGYKTSNTYEDDNFANKLKGMGIRSNADLINFMYKSGKEGWKGDAWQTQFRSDVDRALGGDYSDANIRKVFGTQGKWGRGFMGRGDFGDFQNALQTNAGVWNGMYDAKEQASRTGASGTVYSSPEMMKKFENIELQPNQNNQGLTSSTKFDFSNMKFNNIFTGAQTIGNIPTTVPTDNQTKLA